MIKIRMSKKLQMELLKEKININELLRGTPDHFLRGTHYASCGSIKIKISNTDIATVMEIA